MGNSFPKKSANHWPVNEIDFSYLVSKGNYMLHFILMTAMIICGNAMANENVKSSDIVQIHHVIDRYTEAMNTSNVDKVVELYDERGIFMPNKLPTAIGLNQIRKAYFDEFKHIDLDITVRVDEIVQDASIAYVRTRSDGVLTKLPSQEKISTESYRAFYTLKKRNGEWKIASFMFNFTQ